MISFIARHKYVLLSVFCESWSSTLWS